MDIIVTGVSGGMGLATAKQLIRDGHRIFGLDIKAPEEQYESLLFFQTDLRNEDAVKAAFQSIQEKTDQIGAIIHLAGIYDLNSLVEMSEEEFLRSYEVNLFSVYRVNKTFLPLLKKGSRIRLPFEGRVRSRR